MVVLFLAGYGAFMLALGWFGNYMSQGILQTETLRGDLIVSLTNDTEIRQVLVGIWQSTESSSVSNTGQYPEDG